MSKAVLLSINPRWCSLIASGQKTIEVRKTRPKLKLPFKCFIYETKGKTDAPWMDEDGHMDFHGRGQVIGEFVCDYVSEFEHNGGGFLVNGSIATTIDEVARACLTDKEFREYAGENAVVYGWHISELLIYEKPAPLDWLIAEGDCDCANCRNCSWFNRGNGYNVEDDCDLGYEALHIKKSLKPLFRAPQSWCYVEELTKEAQ